MMKLSVAAELALRGIFVLAGRNDEDPVSLDVICSPRDLPKDYLAKIFGLLVRGDLIIPVRGKHGGYRLARDPARITVLEIVEAVEGPVVLNFCQHDPPKCEQYDCPMRPVWAELQQMIRGKLSSVTLADCVGERKH